MNDEDKVVGGSELGRPEIKTNPKKYIAIGCIPPLSAIDKEEQGVENE